MRLRLKLNLIAVGYCGMAALVMALCGKLLLALISVAMAYLNWRIVLAAEQEDK